LKLHNKKITHKLVTQDKISSSIEYRKNIKILKKYIVYLCQKRKLLLLREVPT